MIRGATRKRILHSAYPSRIQAIESLAAALQGEDGAVDLLEAAATSVKEASVLAQHSTAGSAYHHFGTLLGAVANLMKWERAIRTAELDSNRYLRSAQLAGRDVVREVGQIPSADKVASIASRIAQVSDVDEIRAIAQLLLSVPLPLPIFAPVEVPRPFTERLSTERREQEVVVAFTSFHLNGHPFGDPHTIHPETIHDLSAEITVSRWPDDATELLLEAVSVEPANTYSLPRYRLTRPEGKAPYSFNENGRLLIHYPTAFYARPLEFTYRALFLPETTRSKVHVSGHRHLRVQCFDPLRDPQSGYVQVDKKLLELRDYIRRSAPTSDSELNTFMLLMNVIGGIAGQTLQENLFPRTYSEREFQDEMKRLLRGHSRIGSQLEEHPHAAGGITDLSFYGVRLELKVESEQQVLTRQRILSYANQTAQYVVGSDKQFGVLVVLECSRKREAPGGVSNDIFVETVEPPNGQGSPTWIGVIILRGNLPKPSELAR